MSRPFTRKEVEQTVYRLEMYDLKKYHTVSETDSQFLLADGTKLIKRYTMRNWWSLDFDEVKKRQHQALYQGLANWENALAYFDKYLQEQYFALKVYPEETFEVRQWQDAKPTRTMLIADRGDGVLKHYRRDRNRIDTDIRHLANGVWVSTIEGKPIVRRFLAERYDALNDKFTVERSSTVNDVKEGIIDKRNKNDE